MPEVYAANLSKTAKKSTGKKEVTKKRLCRKCNKGETQVVRFTGYGPIRGFQWVCQDPCGFIEPTRG